MEFRFVWYMALGIMLLLIVKYLLLGLNAWDNIFHPGRIEPSSSIFLSPFLGIFSKGGCANGCNS